MRNMEAVRCAFRSGVGLAAICMLGIGRPAQAQEAKRVGSVGIAQQLPNALVSDPTLVYGLFWYPPGYPTQWMFSDMTRRADIAPLPTGTTGFTGLLWGVNAPVNGDMWDVTMTSVTTGMSWYFHHQFIYYSGSYEGCLTTTISNSKGETYPGNGYCLYGSSPLWMSFGEFDYLPYPCFDISTWFVKMTGPDITATFDGYFQMVADGVGGLALHAPTTLQPALPAQSGGTSLVEPASGPGQGTLTVTALDSVCPSLGVPGAPVQAAFTFLGGSGGHTHATPPLSVDQFQRLLTVTPAGNAAFDASQALLSGVTDGGGNLYASLTGGVAACDFAVVASSPAGGTGSAATITLDPGLGLAEVTDEPGLFFVTGGPGQQCSDPAYCARHASNHHLTLGTLFEVGVFAQQVQWLTDGAVIVGLDDMSLPRGGIFDLHGDFATPHVLHRQGHDVDIVWVQDADTQIFESAKLYEDDLAKAAKMSGGRRVKETPIHFRFPG